MNWPGHIDRLSRRQEFRGRGFGRGGSTYFARQICATFGGVLVLRQNLGPIERGGSVLDHEWV